MSEHFRWEPPVESRGPRLVRQPLRFVLVSGGVLAVVGSFVSAASRTRTVQAVLGMIGAIAVLIWISALSSANREIADWQRQHGTGTIGAGIWIAGAGVALLAVSGAILSIRAWRTSRTRSIRVVCPLDSGIAWAHPPPRFADRRARTGGRRAGKEDDDVSAATKAAAVPSRLRRTARS